MPKNPSGSSRRIGLAVSAIVVIFSYLFLVLLPTPLREVDMQTAAPLLFTPLTRLLPRQLRQLRARTPFYYSSVLSTAPFTASSSRPFTNSTAKMGYDTLSLKDAVQNRRSIYSLTKTCSIPDERVKEIVTQAIKHVPSSFNSQSARVVVLVKDEHDKFWAMVRKILKSHVPEPNWDYTAKRMDMFQGAYGTVLFYEDPEPIKALQSKFPIYAEKFPQWSEHTSAMHQYEIWTALEAEGLGANLQHYNPLPDQQASEIWNIPLEWSLKAQLVFGDTTEGARDQLSTKSEEPIEKRAFFHGF